MKQEIGPLLAVKPGKKVGGLPPLWPLLSAKEAKRQMGKHPDWNVAIRLDNWLTIDADNIEGVLWLLRLDTLGFLPRTVSWISGSGRMVKLYRPPEGAKNYADSDR
jgi:hypothetical protein